MVSETKKDKVHADRYQAAQSQAQGQLYKVNDREGLYVAVTPAGSISFRYNYSINGRQETITFGRYGVGGITLAEARELLGDAKKMVAAGRDRRPGA